MKLLLVEDEKALSKAIRTILQMNHYQVDCAYNGREGLAFVARNSYDCLILDIMMPVMDGITMLKRLRDYGNATPVIMLSAKGELDDRIDGLDAGADDYLTKPFAASELLARIRSVLRRAVDYQPKVLSVGHVSLDLEQMMLKGVNSVHLSPKEGKLLLCLIQNQGTYLTTDMLLEHVWANKQEKDIVYLYIHYLIEKLQAVGADVMIRQDSDAYQLVQVM